MSQFNVYVFLLTSILSRKILDEKESYFNLPLKGVINILKSIITKYLVFAQVSMKIITVLYSCSLSTMHECTLQDQDSQQPRSFRQKLLTTLQLPSSGASYCKRLMNTQNLRNETLQHQRLGQSSGWSQTKMKFCKVYQADLIFSCNIERTCCPAGLSWHWGDVQFLCMVCDKIHSAQQ